jgi:hypothetical protein
LTPEPTDFFDPLFDQDFDEFVESLENLEPYDDLEDWSDDVDLFMEAMFRPPHMTDVFWQEAKLKKQKENPKPCSDEHSKPEKNDPRLDWMGDPISGKNRVLITEPPQESNESIIDKPWIKEPEGLTPVQSWRHWMNENALLVEMGIPLLTHPKHTYSKIGGLIDSESEYSYDSEDELGYLI